MGPTEEQLRWTERVLGVSFVRPEGAALTQHISDQIREDSAAGAIQSKGAAEKSLDYDVPDFSQLSSQWRASQSAAVSALALFGQALIRLEEVRSDPRFPAVKSTVRKFPRALPASVGVLVRRLEAAAKAGHDDADRQRRDLR